MHITRESSRRLARRHLPAACLVSIVVVLQPLPSATIGPSGPASPPAPAPVQTAPVIEMTARLCVSRDHCGSLTARVWPSRRER